MHGHSKECIGKREQITSLYIEFVFVVPTTFYGASHNTCFQHEC